MQFALIRWPAGSLYVSVCVCVFATVHFHRHSANVHTIHLIRSSGHYVNLVFPKPEAPNASIYFKSTTSCINLSFFVDNTKPILVLDTLSMPAYTTTTTTAAVIISHASLFPPPRLAPIYFSRACVVFPDKHLCQNNATRIADEYLNRHRALKR